MLNRTLLSHNHWSFFLHAGAFQLNLGHRQFSLLSFFYDLQILLLKLYSSGEHFRILLVELIAIHEYLVDISVKLAWMLVSFLPEIVLNGFEVHWFQHYIEVLRNA